MLKALIYSSFAILVASQMACSKSKFKEPRFEAKPVATPAPVTAQAAPSSETPAVTETRVEEMKQSEDLPSSTPGQVSVQCEGSIQVGDETTPISKNIEWNGKENSETVLRTFPGNLPSNVSVKINRNTRNLEIVGLALDNQETVTAQGSVLRRVTLQHENHDHGISIQLTCSPKDQAVAQSDVEVSCRGTRGTSGGFKPKVSQTVKAQVQRAQEVSVKSSSKNESRIILSTTIPDKNEPAKFGVTLSNDKVLSTSSSELGQPVKLSYLNVKTKEQVDVLCQPVSLWNMPKISASK